jgi:hypothetical protein
VPCVGGLVSSGDTVGLEDCGAELEDFEGARVEYTVDCADGDQQEFTGNYAGKHHLDEDQLNASASPQNIINCEDPVWEASTDSDPQGDIDAPVDDPVDIVNIEANSDFLGTFSGTWFLVDSTGVEQTGDCDDGVIDDVTGEATLTCDASGLGPYGVQGAETCWTIVITAPDDYVPEGETLVGTGIAEECFIVVSDFRGCTPGYWKQTQHFGSYPAQITPDFTTLGDAGFIPLHGVDSDTTVTDALSLKGGKGEAGAERILLRAASAGLLNAYSLSYPIAPGDLIDLVNAAIASGDRSTMISLAGDIDDDNNGPEDFEGKFCPFGRAPLE